MVTQNRQQPLVLVTGVREAQQRRLLQHQLTIKSQNIGSAAETFGPLQPFPNDLLLKLTGPVFARQWSTLVPT